MLLSQADPTPSYNIVPAVPPLYTRYVDASRPVPASEAGAVHARRMLDWVWCTLAGPAAPATPAGAAGTPGAVDCDSVGLRKPSPAELIAVTSKSYMRPASRPVTSTDRVDPLYVPTAVDTAELAVPELRYRVYPITGVPPDTTEAAHVTLMLVAVCDTLDNVAGAAGDVDW